MFYGKPAENGCDELDGILAVRLVDTSLKFQ